MATLDETIQPAAVSYQNLSPISKDVSSLYDPFCNEAFRNYDELYIDNGFFPFAPEIYRTYLWRVVRRNMWWWRGFVPGIHDHGVLSGKVGSRICKRIGELIMLGGFRVEGFDTGERFLEAFIKSNQVKLKLTKHLVRLNAIGNMLAKLDFKADNKLGMNFVSGNKYFAVVDEDQIVHQFRALIEYIGPEPIEDASQPTKNQEGYFLCEERKLDGVEAYQRFVLYKAPAAMVSPVFGGFQEVKAIPKRIQSRVSKVLGQCKLGEVYLLPFKNNIGAEVILNSSVVTGIDFNGFSDSTLADCHTQLFQYDITNTQKEGNKYFAQTGVLIPDNMIPPEISSNPSGNAQQKFLQNQQTLDGRIYKKVPYLDSKQQQHPEFFQAQNQAQVYNEDLKEIEATIATMCGLTPTALAGNLMANGDRTATEVLNNDDITRATIEQKRDLIREPMTRLFKEVLKYYEISKDGSVDDIEMVFNSSVMGNPERETNDITAQINGGIMSRKTGIARKNRSYSKKEVEEELKQIEAEDQKKVQSGADGLWNGI